MSQRLKLVLAGAGYGTAEDVPFQSCCRIGTTEVVPLLIAVPNQILRSKDAY